MGILTKPHFRGQSIARLDGKGRLRVPTKYREVLQKHYTDALIITQLPECLVAFPPEIWEELEARILETSRVEPNQREFERLFISSAEECEFDNQGRILIPSVLKKYGGLEQEVLIAGMLNRLEIWEKGRWDRRIEWTRDHPQEISETMARFGL